MTYDLAGGIATGSLVSSHTAFKRIQSSFIFLNKPENRSKMLIFEIITLDTYG